MQPGLQMNSVRSSVRREWGNGWIPKRSAFCWTPPPRTLQTLRENGTLAYSRISHKVYYRPEDIQKILSAIQKRKGGQI